MRDPARINRIIDLLSTHWHRNPDARLGQLLMCLTPFQNEVNRTIFNTEDNVIERALAEALTKFKVGDRVYHVYLKEQGIVVEYPGAGYPSSECIAVQFDFEGDEVREVSTHCLRHMGTNV